MPLGCAGYLGQGSVDGKLQGKKTKFGKGLEDAEGVQETYDTWKESFGSCGYISETMVISLIWQQPNPSTGQCGQRCPVRVVSKDAGQVSTYVERILQCPEVNVSSKFIKFLQI